jgi:AraC-like DNA-binding protein
VYCKLSTRHRAATAVAAAPTVNPGMRVSPKRHLFAAMYSIISGCEAGRNDHGAAPLILSSLGLKSKTRAFNMPDSEVMTFTDPDAYHANIRRSRVEGGVTGRGEYRTELTRIDLHRLWMQRGDESLPRVLDVSPSGERPAIVFGTNQNQLAMHFDGRELPQHEIIITGSGVPIHFRSSGACHWGAISLSLQDLAAAQAITGREFIAPFFTQFIRPPPAFLARLSNLHGAAAHLARTAPDILVHPEVARALEQGLVHAMVSCISGGEAAETGSVRHRHAVIMRRLEEVLEANPDRTLYVAELCGAAGASGRTLRACCQEHLGMRPTRYLWLRRMHLARRALRMADPAAASVTEIATSYGFWELGRFSVAYRSLFGESPSASLRRPPDAPRPQKNTGSPWKLPESA